ncbi:MAG TPA: Crp/Fnr family transcriptional regulator [Caulobacter sp.]|nr:Crp/Fnr family transcriptional regulator [Caulobacter sp.]
MARGQVIYDEGEPPGVMYRLEAGCVRLQVNGEDGDRQIVAFLFPGELFGFCLDRRSTSAEAVSEVEVTRFMTRMVLEKSVARPDVVVELINRSNALFGVLAHHVEKITHLPAHERLIWFFNWLLRHADDARAPGVIELPMNYRDIADFLSLKPETLSRALKQLEDTGYLVRRGQRTVVLRQACVALPLRAGDRLAATQADSATG